MSYRQTDQIQQLQIALWLKGLSSTPYLILFSAPLVLGMLWPWLHSYGVTVYLLSIAINAILAQQVYGHCGQQPPEPEQMPATLRATYLVSAQQGMIYASIPWLFGQPGDAFNLMMVTFIPLGAVLTYASGSTTHFRGFFPPALPCVLSLLSYLISYGEIQSWAIAAWVLLFCIIMLGWVRNGDAATGDTLKLRHEKDQLIHELDAQRQRAEQANIHKSQFLANMSHEIRTPMNGVLTMAKVLQGTTLSRSQQEYVDDMISTGNAMVEILNDILDISSIEAGTLKPKSQAFNPRALVEEIHGLFSHCAEAKQQQLRVQISDPLPETLSGDLHRLRQVLNNLVSNAIKYSEQAEITIALTPLEQTHSEVTLEFSVIDKGPGIPNDQLTHIFDHYRRLDGPRYRVHEGTGLGLAIASKLVTLMGGNLKVESQLGSGSRFFFSLTLPISTRSLSPETQRVPDAARSLHILMADDDHLNRIGGRILLERAGHEVSTVENGQEALDYLDTHNQRPDLILMDVHMPIMNGLEFSRRLRHHEHHPLRSIPIIGLTASAMEEELKEYLASGMDVVLTKPINIEDIISSWRALQPTPP